MDTTRRKRVLSRELICVSFTAYHREKRQETIVQSTMEGWTGVQMVRKKDVEATSSGGKVKPLRRRPPLPNRCCLLRSGVPGATPANVRFSIPKHSCAPQGTWLMVCRRRAFLDLHSSGSSSLSPFCCRLSSHFSKGQVNETARPYVSAGMRDHGIINQFLAHLYQRPWHIVKSDRARKFVSFLWLHENFTNFSKNTYTQTSNSDWLVMLLCFVVARKSL